MFFEERVEGGETLGNAFGVIDPVDADAEDLCGADLLPPGLHGAVHFRGGGGTGLSVEIDADRKRADCRPWAAPETRYGVEEAVAVFLQVKAEQVVAEHSFEDLPLPGENPKALGGRPGDVPELADNQVRPSRLQ